MGHGNAAPKPIVFPEAQGAELPEGNNDPCANRARRGTSPAGCSTMARTKRTAQTPGRPSPLLDISRSGGEPATRLRRTARCGRTCRRPQEAQNKRPHRGRPPARGTGAVVEGGRESEGCIGAMTSGNEVALGPDRAKAARVGVNFRREPCPMRRHWWTCHQDF